jgi:hypothetical protein
MERGSRKRSATTAGQTRSAGGAANSIPDGTAGPWVIDGLPITIYPPTESNRYYQIVWYEEGRRRTTSAGTSHRKAEIKADTIARRLVAQAFASERPVKDLVEAWLSPNRPRKRPWSLTHADGSRWLAETHIVPTIGGVQCAALRTSDLQKAVNHTPTPGEARRVLSQLGTMLRWGWGNGYLVTEPTRLLAGVHAPSATVPATHGEDELLVDPAKVPDADAIEALAIGMSLVPRATFADSLSIMLDAYSGLRLGELLALRASDIDLSRRLVGVNRQVVEVKGGLRLVPPKGNKIRKSVYPAVTPEGFDLEESVKRRVLEVRESDPEGLLFPAPAGGLWTPSNFGERRFRPAARIAWWPVEPGSSVDGSYGKLLWTMHSLRHRYATWLLWERNASPADVSMAMGHADVSITLRVYASSVSGALDRLGALT